MILITGLIYAIFVKIILQHLGMEVSYWFSYGIVLTLGLIISDSAGEAIEATLNEWRKRK